MNEFDMSDLEKMCYFLGIEVSQRAGDIFISQEKYIAEVLDRFQMKNCNSASTLMDARMKLVRNPDGKRVDSTFYKQIVGISENQVTDILTKPLKLSVFEKLRRMLNIYTLN